MKGVGKLRSKAVTSRAFKPNAVMVSKFAPVALPMTLSVFVDAL